MTGYRLGVALVCVERPLGDVVTQCDYRPATVVSALLAWGEEGQPEQIAWRVRGTALVEGELFDFESVEEWATQPEAQTALDLVLAEVK